MVNLQGSKTKEEKKQFGLAMSRAKR